MDREILHRRRVPPSEMFGILEGTHWKVGWIIGQWRPFPCFFSFFLSFIRIGVGA